MDQVRFNQPQAERAEVLAEIFDSPETKGLDEAQLTDHLRDFIRTNSVEGVLKSRSLVTQLMPKLIRHLIDLGLTDQQLFEHLDDLARFATDEYRPWSPEYTFPVSNHQAQWIASHDDYQHLLDVVSSDSDEFCAYDLGSSLEPGLVIVWTEDLPNPTEYLSRADFARIKAEFAG